MTGLAILTEFILNMTEEAQQANESEENWVVTAMKNRLSWIKAGLQSKNGLWLQRLSRENDKVGYAKVTSKEDLQNSISDVIRKVVHERAIQDQTIEASSQGRRDNPHQGSRSRDWWRICHKQIGRSP